MVEIGFKTINDALEFLRSHGKIGDNSAGYQVDLWVKQEEKELRRQGTSLKSALKKFFKRASSDAHTG